MCFFFIIPVVFFFSGIRTDISSRTPLEISSVIYTEIPMEISEGMFRTITSEIHADNPKESPPGILELLQSVFQAGITPEIPTEIH